MIRKMAKILLPWFILSNLPHLSNFIANYAAATLGASALAGLSIGSTILHLPISFFTCLSLAGLTLSAILQEKGNLKGGLGVHIGFTCASMGLMLTFYLAAIFFPNQLMMMYGSPADIISMGSSYVTAASLTILLLIVPFLLIGQLILKKPSLLLTLILAGVLLAHMWIGYLLISASQMGLLGLGIVDGMQIAILHILPFALIPIRGYWRTFAPEENAPCCAPETAAEA